MALANFYEKKYKQLLVASLILLFLGFAVLGYKYVSTGEIVNKGVSLKGGITVTFPADGKTIEQVRTEINIPDISVRGVTEAGILQFIIIEASELTEQEIISALNSIGYSLEKGSYSVESIRSALG